MKSDNAIIICILVIFVCFLGWRVNKQLNTLPENVLTPDPPISLDAVPINTPPPTFVNFQTAQAAPYRLTMRGMMMHPEPIPYVENRGSGNSYDGF